MTDHTNHADHESCPESQTNASVSEHCASEHCASGQCHDRNCGCGSTGDSGCGDVDVWRERGVVVAARLGHGLLKTLKWTGRFLWAALRMGCRGVAALVKRWRSRRQLVADDDATTLNLAMLEQNLLPLPADVPQVILYGVPVRLAAIVIAPAGTHQPLCGYREMARVLEMTIPSFARVLKLHSPKIIPWAAQLSTTGFTAKFHAATPFPTAPTTETASASEFEYGLVAGTHWCSAVGPMIRSTGRDARSDATLLVGFLFYSPTLTTVGRAIADQPRAWRTFCAVQ